MKALGLEFRRVGTSATVDGIPFATVPAAWANFIDRVELRGQVRIGEGESFPVRIGEHCFQTNGRTARTWLAGKGSYSTSQYPAEAWTAFIQRADLAARRQLAAYLAKHHRDPVTGEEMTPCCTTTATPANTATAAAPPAPACAPTAAARTASP